MDPASIALVIKLIDLAMLGATAGMSYIDAKRKNAPLIAELESLRTRMILGDEMTADDSARMSTLIDQAQAARKAARDRVKVPNGYAGR